MAIDKLPTWFMQTILAAELMTLVKAEAKLTGDHRPIQVPNTLAKAGDKAVLEQCQVDYLREMMPHQVGVGVKFAAELLAMGLRMVMYLRGGFILINIDINQCLQRYQEGSGGRSSHEKNPLREVGAVLEV